MDLSAIEARANAYRAFHDHPHAFACCHAHDTADDVPALVERVRELEESNRQLSEQANLWEGHVDRLEASGREARESRDQERMKTAKKIRELEAERDEDAGVIRALRRQRDQAEAALDVATRFDFGNGVTVHQQPDKSWRITWPDPDAPGDPDRFHPMTEDHTDCDAALARARQITKEEQ